MRAPALAALAAIGALAWGGSNVWADGRCDLNNVVGYHILFGKPIDSYVQNGVTLSSNGVGAFPEYSPFGFQGRFVYARLSYSW